MTIDQIEVVDAIGIDNETGELILTIVDHLEWQGNDEHLLLLQDKLNTYLAFVESGELLEAYPQSKDRAVAIRLVCKHQLNKQAEVMVDRFAAVVQDAGMKLTYSVFGED